MRWLAELSSRHGTAHVAGLPAPGPGCAEVCRRLPLVVDGGERLSPAAAEHLRSCPACRSELAGYRHLLDLLRSLRYEHLAVAGPLLGDQTWAAITEHLRARTRAGERRRVVGAAAVALVVLGGAAVARATRQAKVLAGATATA